MSEGIHIKLQMTKGVVMKVLLVASYGVANWKHDLQAIQD